MTAHPPAAPQRTARLGARAHLLLLLALVLLVRLPFLNQAVGGDDVYYLAAAYHGLVDPLHPNHTWYVFEGRDVTFQGYPHPPGNAWALMALLAAFGDVYEVPFHAAYILFSLMAAGGMYALARRFSCAPFWAAALFIAVPEFCVNGNLFESDVPLAAFWISGAAAFIWGVDKRNRALILFAGALLAGAGLIAMQSAVFSLILIGYLLMDRERRSLGRFLAASMPVVALAAWQLFERATSGVFPFAVSAAYMTSYGYERLAPKLRNAAGLAIHSVFLVLPLILPFAVPPIWRQRRTGDTRFLVLWIAVWFAASCVLFYSGSARYLLPMAPPVVLLLSRAPVRWLQVTFALQLVISLGLAAVNEQHWDAYRAFEAGLRKQFASKRVWVDAEWSLRHYFEADGALPSHRNQWIPTGDVVIESELAYPAPFLHGGRMLTPVAEMVINPALPLRLIGIDSHSGYSTVDKGFLPFGVGGVIDRVHAYLLRQVDPKLSRLPMDAPEAESQILYGIDSLEGHTWRWMEGQGALLLKSPGTPAVLTVHFYVAPAAPARSLRVAVTGGPEKTQSIPGPGSYTLTLPVDAAKFSSVTVQISVDKTFRPPGDNRDLGIILSEVGFNQ